MAQPVIHFYEFGPFRLAPTERLLLRDDQPVPLAPKLFDILVVLVEGHGRMLSKDELMQAVWPDAFVEEGNLTRNVSTLRRALSEGGNEQQYIQTVQKHGYRFVAEVRGFGNEDAELAVRERIRTSVVIEEEETNGQVKAEVGLASLEMIQGKRWTVGWRSWRVLVVVVLLLGLVVGVGYWRGSRRASQTELGEMVRSVAVMPFRPLNPGNNDDYLELGLADSLITRLSSLRSLIVRPTSAVRKYSSPTQDALAAGREQRVDAVLDGSLQRDGEHIRVTARLLRVRDGRALWSYQCEEVRCENLFAMQDLISEGVAAALMPRLAGEERTRLRKHSTEDKEANRVYMWGRHFSSMRTSEGLKRGIEYFVQAIEKDPNYALAYAGLADCYSLLANYAEISPKEGFPKAKAAALKALTIDDSLGEVHASLAKILHLYDWNWAEADKQFKRAIELNPRYAPAHQWYGEYLISLERFGESKAELEQALELDPVSLSINTAQGFPYFYLREYDQAIAAYRNALELDPNFFAAHHWLALAYEQKGMSEQALAEYLEPYRISGSHPEWIERAKDVYAASGLRGFWQARSTGLVGTAPQKYDSKYGMALMYARLGQREETFKWLYRAFEDREPSLAQSLKVHPLFDAMRGDPRFTDVVCRIGLLP